MTVLPPTDEGLAIAAAAVRAGEVVAYPTETLYGLAVDPFNEDALRRLFDVKGRDAAQAVILIVAEPDQVHAVASEVSPAARRYMERFWPGPLSLILPKSERLPESVTGGRPKICVRCPASDTARAFCRAVGGPITSTSANLSGERPALSVGEINLPGVEFAIDGGKLFSLTPSTVFDPDTGVVLREGVITEAELRSVTG